jgi:hypothetical protein
MMSNLKLFAFIQDPTTSFLVTLEHMLSRSNLMSIMEILKKKEYLMMIEMVNY